MDYNRRAIWIGILMLVLIFFCTGCLQHQNKISYLEQSNLSLTNEQISSDLQKHTELIPVKDVLGGKMSFTNDDIRILSNRWVTARFSDGHIKGYMLLKYTNNNGSIAWEVLDSYQYP